MPESRSTPMPPAGAPARELALVSLPPAATAAGLADRIGDVPVLVASDPPGRQLGSGGGTVALLQAGWRRDAPGTALDAWLAARRILVIHGSGESRRLPAYAAEGKPLLPLPALDDLPGQAPMGTLLDAQARSYLRLLRQAPADCALMVACGDVLVRWEQWLPVMPTADITIVGLESRPEELTHHGAMICPADAPTVLDRFLQKPSVQTLRQIGRTHRAFLDTGIWLFSARAAAVLLRRCGWRSGVKPDWTVKPYDLYGAFGLALGRAPEARDAAIARLSAAVLPLHNGRFFHFGTNRSILASVSALQTSAAQRTAIGPAEDGARPVVLNARVEPPLTARQRELWIERSVIPRDWILRDRHVLTGIPANDWALDLPAGLCLDVTPLMDGALLLRPYGFDDQFRGALGDPGTLWMGRPFTEWLAARDLTWQSAGLTPALDFYDAPLFPCAPADPGALLRWMIAAKPAADAAARAAWLAAPRQAARALLRDADIRRLRRDRTALFTAHELPRRLAAWEDHTARQADLAALARLLVTRSRALASPRGGGAGLPRMHARMLAAAGAPAARRLALERAALGDLAAAIVAQTAMRPVRPRRVALADQIVWGRSPVRLDLAGGWTDTPPYCLEHGGQVVNLASTLNGQPPIQVFARPTERPELVVSSIDLGVKTVFKSYADLARGDRLGGGFGIARMAFRLAGFDPRFHTDPGRYPSLRRQLASELGGGLEISLLAAVPKGSGLGTSSILAATLLGTLGDLLGLGWNHTDIFTRTLTLEQMLTSGGGWQDQVGGLHGGVKHLHSRPGLIQTPSVHWLPDGVFSSDLVNRQILLYYTGLTRVAHSILGEIVRGMCLNEAARLDTLDEIGRNAAMMADALQRQDWRDMGESLRRSWALNCRLDPGTNPPAVRRILAAIAPETDAAKLLGAGGGGYLLILARDPEAGLRLRRKLAANPPNERARFVAMGLSAEGYRVTRS